MRSYSESKRSLKWHWIYTTIYERDTWGNKRPGNEGPSPSDLIVTLSQYIDMLRLFWFFKNLTSRCSMAEYDVEKWWAAGDTLQFQTLTWADVRLVRPDWLYLATLCYRSWCHFNRVVLSDILNCFRVSARTWIGAHTAHSGMHSKRSKLRHVLPFRWVTIYLISRTDHKLWSVLVDEMSKCLRSTAARVRLWVTE